MKRWIDAGHIPAARTSGGHRRVTLVDALRYIRARGLAVPHPEYLGIQSPPPDDALTADALLDALRAADRARVQGLIVGAYLAGTPLAAIFDGPVREAAVVLGEACTTHYDSGVVMEHAATALLADALGYLAGVMTPVSEGAPLAVGGALPHDPYSMASQMVALVLADRGWSTLNLGAHLPVSALRYAAEQRGARLVWLSCSARVGSETYEKIRTLSDGLAERGVLFVAGGPMRHELDGIDGLHLGNSMADLLDVIASLQTEAAA